MSENQNSEASAERQLYDGVALQVRHVGLSFSDLKTLFPDRVLLTRLDDIFRAWRIATIIFLLSRRSP
jgi:hypothetical protein